MSRSSLRSMTGTRAVRLMCLMAGGYLIALGIFCGALPRMARNLLVDPLVTRSMGATLAVAGVSVAWIAVRVYGPKTGTLVLVPSLPPMLAGLAFLLRPTLLLHPMIQQFPWILAWIFGGMGIILLGEARWVGRSD